MAWGPQGETKREEREVTKEELESELMVKVNKGLCGEELRRFIACIQDGDKIIYQSESDNHRGYARYVGRNTIYYTGDDGKTYTQTGSFCYTLVLNSFMS